MLESHVDVHPNTVRLSGAFDHVISREISSMG